MAKRLTDTNKLKKKWIRGLKAPYKLLWVYLLDACDHAGIWEVDFEIANIYVGGGITEDKAKQLLNGKIFPFDNGDKWLILDFIDFQYGGLNEKNPAHKNVIKQLSKYGFLNDDLSLKIEGVESPLTLPLEGGKEKEKEKEKEKVKVKEEVKEEVKEIDLVLPFDTENFIKWWNVWKNYKKKEHKFSFKSEISEQASLKKLASISNNDEETAINIIENSIANGYKGLFEITGRKINNKSISDEYKLQILNDLE